VDDKLSKASDDDQDEPTVPVESRKPYTDDGKGLSAGATIVISMVTALITSVLAPFFVELWKDRDLSRQLDRAKQERIIATQFDTVERFNAMFWRYRQAAGFLMFDFSHGQSDELLKRHLKEFEDVSAEANREMPTQAFRARMYFRSVYVNNKLFTIWANIFRGVDNEISQQLLNDQNTVHLRDQTSVNSWLKISEEINDTMLSSQTALNEVYQLIGKPNIDEAMSPGQEIKLYRLNQ
jgi:hypothetical protein